VKSRLENLQKRSKTCKCARKWEIEEVLDDSGSLLYMESVLSESCEELEIYIENLSLDDDDGEC
jgi:hypothetical protein